MQELPVTVLKQAILNAVSTIFVCAVYCLAPGRYSFKTHIQPPACCLWLRATHPLPQGCCTAVA